MDQSEIISVIIPVYNVEPYLEKCLNSVCDQTYRNLDIILVNDGSTDRSGFICNQFAQRDNRIRVINQKNTGQSAARNQGLDIAIGAYIGFVDSDDWIEVGMYKALLSVLKEQEVDIVACGISIDPINSKKRQMEQSVQLNYNTDQALCNILTEGNLRFEVWNKLYRKECIESLRFKTNQIHEEIYFTTHVFLQSCQIAFVEYPFYHYLQKRQGNTNSTFKENRLSIFKEFDELIDELKLRNMECNAQHAEILRMIFLLSFYKMARDYQGTSEELFQTLLTLFNKYYPSLKKNSFFSEIKLKAWLFNLNPRLYYWLAKSKSKD